MPDITQSVDSDFLFPASGYKAVAVVAELKNEQYHLKVKPISVSHQLAEEALNAGIRSGIAGLSFMEYWPVLGVQYSSGTRQAISANNETALDLHKTFNVENLSYDSGTEALLQVEREAGSLIEYGSVAKYVVELKKGENPIWSPSSGSTVLKVGSSQQFFEIDFGYSTGNAYALDTNKVETFRFKGTSLGSWVWRNNYGMVVGRAKANLHGLPLGASKVYYTLLDGNQSGDKSVPEFYYRSGSSNVKVSSALNTVLDSIAGVRFYVNTENDEDGRFIFTTYTYPVLVWIVVYYDLRALVNVLNQNASTFKLEEESLYLLGTGEGAPRTPWHYPAHKYRLFGLGTRLPRHPLMPLDLEQMQVVGLNGSPKAWSKDGDVLVFQDHGPHIVYFTPKTSGVSPVAKGNTDGYWSMLQIKDQLYGYEPSDYWWVVRLGGYGQEPGRVNENTESIYDATDYVYSISTEELGLVVPKSVESSIVQTAVYPVFVGVSTLTGEFAPALYKYAVRTTLEYYADKLDVRIDLVGLKELYNVEITDALKKLYGGVPLTDEAWVAGLMKTNLSGKFSKEPGVRFRSAMYWLDTPPNGPGMPEDEWLSRYKNGVLGSLTEEIEAVLQANMLTAVERPDGGLHVVPIVPYPGASHRDFINGRVPVLFYHTNPNDWGYYPDPKLDVSAVEIDLEGAFAKVEVEGYSNTVTGELSWTYARFVQGGKETTQLEIDSGLWGDAAAAFTGYINQQRDGSGNLDDPNSVQSGQLDFNVSGFRFRVLSNGVPKAKYYPLKWYEKLSSAPSESQFSFTSGDSNWWVRFERFLYGMATDSYAASNSLTDNKKLVIGFRAWPERNFCGAVLGDPFFTMKLKVPDVDQATLKVLPLVGGPTSTFAPRWFREFLKLVEANYAKYPRKLKRIQNPYIGEIWSPYYAVQHEWLEAIAPGKAAEAYSSKDAMASHLATWLTFREFLKTRRVKLRYAGYAPWRQGQIVAVAAKPTFGNTVKQLTFLLLEEVKFYGQVGGEVWTEASASFMFRLDMEKWGVKYGIPGDIIEEDANVVVVTSPSVQQLMTAYVQAEG